MLLKQYYLGCLAHASYLIADTATGTAVVVDPQRDIDQYLQDATQYGCHIRYVFLTHFHADFLAGHLELRDRVGATICLGGQAQADYTFTPFKHGDVLEFGGVRLEILETPGHTPEAICILVYDLQRNAQQPHAVLTGDTLFIGDVGRPDLMASVGMSAAELAAMLYDSLLQKLLPLPDETLVYPAHGAGSMCGKNLSSDTVSTLGTQRRLNYALQPMSKEAFVALVTADQPEAPAYFAYDAMLNRHEHPTLSQTLQRVLRPLGLDEIIRHQNAGAQVLDVREPADYAGQHLTGSVNIGLNGAFATWAGTVLDPKQPLVLVAEPGREEEAAMRLGRIGFDHIVGYLDGGARTLAARPELTRSIPRLTPAQLATQLATPLPPLVLDVRTAGERRDKHIAGSLHMPLNRLPRHLDDIPRHRGLVIHCAGGYRSSIAMSLLERHGLTQLADLAGGMAAWDTAGLETVTPATAPTPYTLAEFVQALRRITSETQEPRLIVRRVGPLAQRLAVAKDWLQPQHYLCDQEQGFGVHLLHEEADHTLAVFAIAWLPGRGAPPHNHGTWAVVAGVDGLEKNTFWKRLDNASRPGYAEVVWHGEKVFGPGEVVAFLPHDLHSVTNETPAVTVSLHVYGKHLNYTGRSQFDPSAKTEMPFLIRHD
jgi:glyoxylase-like metal-dependent hydrolase (beta-lactamase superfamily II)/rhodanese-related sulfurtransferase/predicted metal-dependent enzyme (double-stranded beta helix superfamily)